MSTESRDAPDPLPAAESGAVETRTLLLFATRGPVVADLLAASIHPAPEEVDGARQRRLEARLAEIDEAIIHLHRHLVDEHTERCATRPMLSERLQFRSLAHDGLQVAIRAYDKRFGSFATWSLQLSRRAALKSVTGFHWHCTLPEEFDCWATVVGVAVTLRRLDPSAVPSSR